MSHTINVVPSILQENPPMVFKINYSVNSFIFKTIISFNVILLDDNNNIFSVKLITLEGEDYKKWGNDDNYVIEYICKKLNLSPKLDPAVVPVVETPVVPVVETPVVPAVETPVVPVEETPVVPVEETPVVPPEEPMNPL